MEESIYEKTISVMLLLAVSLSMLSGCSPHGSSEFNSIKSINVVSREDGSGTRTAFVELFEIEEKYDDGGRKDMTTKEAVITNQTSVVMTGIASDKYAIGYISLGSLNHMVKAVRVDGTEATAENVKDGTYTISRPFNIATKGEISEVAKDFIDYILSADGQGVVAESYIVVDDDAAPYSGAKPNGKIVVAGSSSVTPIMEKLKEAYLEINPNAAIEIQESDSSAGMMGVIEGTCDIGMASRELKDSELEQITPAQIAIDGIAIIVNNDNAVTDLTKEQVRMIYTGEVLQWSEIIE